MILGTSVSHGICDVMLVPGGFNLFSLFFSERNIIPRSQLRLPKFLGRESMKMIKILSFYQIYISFLQRSRFSKCIFHILNDILENIQIFDVVRISLPIGHSRLKPSHDSGKTRLGHPKDNWAMKKNTWLFRVFQAIILPTHVGIVISHYKDP